MKKPLIQLMKEAGLEWPEGANYAAQDKRKNRSYSMPRNLPSPRKTEMNGFTMMMRGVQYISLDPSRNFVRSGAKP